MLGYQKGEICILRLTVLILKAVAVYCNDSVGILVDYDPVGVHAESPDIILELLRPVNDLALIELIGNVFEDDRRDLDPDTDIHAVGFGRDPQVTADSAHPFTAAAAGGHNTVSALEGPACCLGGISVFLVRCGIFFFFLQMDLVALPQLFDLFHGRVEIEIHPVL